MGASGYRRSGGVVEGKPLVLSDVFDVEHNSFNIFRLLFAAAVIFGHAMYVNGVEHSWWSFLWLNQLPVNGFFVLSGYFLAHSWVVSR